MGRETVEKSKIQDPKSKPAVWIVKFGFWGGQAGAGGDGYVAIALVWAGWPPEFGVVGKAQACKQKVGGSIPPVRGPNSPISTERFCWKPRLGFQPRVVETGAQFPEKSS